MGRAFSYHPHCKISRMTHGLYTPPLPDFTSFNATVVVSCALQKKCRYVLIGIVPRFILDAEWFHIFLPFLCRIQDWWSAFSTHWVPCNVTTLSEMLRPSVETFKINSHLQGYFITICPATARPFFHVWQNHSNNSSFILPCFASQIICFEISRFAEPAVNSNFVTMLIRVRVHEPGLFHFHFF
jgi:hypothetical protein